MGSGFITQRAQSGALREVGWGCWKEAQEGGDICVPMAGSCCCTSETSTTLWSNYPPIKSKLRIFFTAICSVSCSVVCLTLCDFMDCSLSGSSVHEILQVGILEWVAIPFSRGSSWPRDWTQVSSIAGRSFTIWATREAPLLKLSPRCYFF